MGKIGRYILWASLVIAFIGCAAASREIWLKSRSEKENIFSESVKDPIPSGKAELRIRTSIKTKLPVPPKDIATRGYPFLLNIDGQAATWRVFGQRERSGKTKHERGEGLRYALEKNLVLSAGLHRIFFALPEEDCSVQFEATLKEGESYSLEFDPLYEECLTRHKSFQHGVSGLQILLNQKPVSPEPKD